MPRFPWKHLVVAFILALALVAPAAAQSSAGFGLRVAFLKYSKPDFETLAFTRPLKLANGDQFRLYLQVTSPAFTYVLYEDAVGTLTPLFQAPMKAEQMLWLPSETENFTLEPPAGIEKLHLIASTERQPKLEKLLASLGTGGPNAVQAVLDEVVRIRQAGSTLAEAPEKPAPMGGVTRGVKASIPKATEFQGLTTYVKTIRIEH